MCHSYLRDDKRKLWEIFLVPQYLTRRIIPRLQDPDIVIVGHDMGMNKVKHRYKSFPHNSQPNT